MELKCLFPYIVAVQRQKSIFSELSGIVFTLLTEKKKSFSPNVPVLLTLLVVGVRGTIIHDPLQALRRAQLLENHFKKFSACY